MKILTLKQTVKKVKKLIETQTDKKDSYVVIHKQLLQTLMDNVRKS